MSSDRCRAIHIAVAAAEESSRRRPRNDEERKGRRRLLLTIGPTGVYLILAVLFLAILGGGTYLAYRSNRGRASDRTATTASRGQEGSAGEGP